MSSNASRRLSFWFSLFVYRTTLISLKFRCPLRLRMLRLYPRRNGLSVYGFPSQQSYKLVRFIFFIVNSVLYHCRSTDVSHATPYVSGAHWLRRAVSPGGQRATLNVRAKFKYTIFFFPNTCSVSIRITAYLGWLRTPVQRSTHVVTGVLKSYYNACVYTCMCVRARARKIHWR